MPNQSAAVYSVTILYQSEKCNIGLQTYSSSQRNATQGCTVLLLFLFVQHYPFFSIFPGCPKINQKWSSTGEFILLGRCFLDWITAVAGEGDARWLYVSFICHGIGGIQKTSAQSTECFGTGTVWLQSFVIVFVCTVAPILSISASCRKSSLLASQLEKYVCDQMCSRPARIFFRITPQTPQ